VTLAPERALRHELETAWARSDRIFGLLLPGALLERPIPLRHPFLFYLGHLPAFAWNQIGRGGLGQGALRAEFDDLFARGIDPRDTAGTEAEASVARWPDEGSVLEYRDRARQAVRSALDALPAAEWRRVPLVLEHELMHHETLLYMLQELDHGWKRAPAAAGGTDPAVRAPPAAPPPRHSLAVAAGCARLGARREERRFGWDNEFPEHEVEVPGFELDDRPVTNGEFLEFVRDGGYDRRDLWSAEAWAWLASRGERHPHGWRRAGGTWVVRAPFEDVAFERARHWPASVAWVEAAAYASYHGRRLMTEAEFHRAAYGDEAEAATGAARRATLGLTCWSQQPVCSTPGAIAPSGARELIGNGWEWTSTPFSPFPGFRADLPDYPGYSADFFDGRHFVLLGGSWATDARFARRSFRNWYQPHYPFVFSKFRTAGPAGRPRPKEGG